MEVIKTSIDGVVIIEPRIFRDERDISSKVSRRGNSTKSRTYRFVQDNESMSVYGVMRGLHFQRPPYAQSKLVRCVRGKVLDVAVDIRVGSATYGQHVAVELSEENHRQLFIPKGFAHGFSVLSKEAVSSTNATISIILNQTEASASWTTASASTGKFLPSQQS